MIICLCQFLSFFFTIFLSIKEVFKVFLYSSVITLIQSLSFLNPIISFEIYSIVIKIAILVNKAVLLDIIIPASGLMKPIVGEPTAKSDPTKISVITSNIFFLFKLQYFSL